MNKKTAIILLGLITAFTIASHFENNYSAECQVTARDGVFVTLTDTNGNEWDYIPEGKYPTVGDTVTVKFNTNGTVNDNSDDEITEVKF